MFLGAFWGPGGSRIPQLDPIYHENALLVIRIKKRYDTLELSGITMQIFCYGLFLGFLGSF